MNNYFTHDSNARNSDKIIPLRSKMGAEGYGIYFMILERLREEPSYMSVKDYNMLAFDLRVDAAKVKAVVENFGLFVFTDDGKYFYSESFTRRMQAKDEKSEKARKSAQSRWEGNSNAMRTQCERNANAVRTDGKTDAIKEKESKVNTSSTDTPYPPKKITTPSNSKEFVPPSLDEVVEYFDEKGYTREAAERAYAYYTEQNWSDRNGSPVKNWKSKCVAVWFKLENKKPSPDDASDAVDFRSWIPL